MAKKKAYVMSGKGGERYAFTYKELQKARARFMKIHYKIQFHKPYPPLANKQRMGFQPSSSTATKHILER